MARKARTIEEAQAAPEATKPKRKTKAKEQPAAPEIPSPAQPTASPTYFGYEIQKQAAISFGDLHVHARTLDRCAAVLRRVGREAKSNDAMIICNGDFWHQRQALVVRQLDVILDCVEEWRREEIPVVFIPGNHDQVSMDGLVHAVRVLESRGIVVATQPLVDIKRKVAFLPWRERIEEQHALFDKLPGSGWTIFGHAEVAGALANNGHTADGKVALGTIEAHAKACYLNHYHRRQKLGGCTWYLGSPFEQDKGEAMTKEGQRVPHGIAFIRFGYPEPHFIDLDELPKHYSFTFGDDVPPIREQDIVEVYAPPAQLASVEFGAFIQKLPTRDVRPLPARATPAEPEEGAVPTVALGMEQALVEYVKASTVPEEKREAFVRFGREILSRVTDSKTIIPLSPQVRVVEATVTDFMTVRGTISMRLDRQGGICLRGPMGIGKTSFADAIPWCLFGATTPRKAGTHGAAPRGDSVVNDDAKVAHVEVRLKLAGLDPLVVITRSRKRGSSAEIGLRWEGGEPPPGFTAGITDTQELVHRIVGMDYEMWRSAVYLGQGNVISWLTDGNKKRVELLSRPFGLASCAPAQKIVRIEAEKHTRERDKLADVIARAESRLDTLRGMDLATQSVAWETEQRVKGEAATALITHHTANLAQIDAHLAGEADWLQRKQQFDTHLGTLMKSAQDHSSTKALRDLAMQIGATDGELGTVNREHERLAKLYEQLIKNASTRAPACPMCGQTIDMERHEAHVEEVEGQVRSVKGTKDALQAKLASLRSKQAEIEMQGTGAIQVINNQITETRTTLSSIGEALNTYTRLRSNRESSDRELTTARANLEAIAKQVNPFAAKVAEMADEIARLESQLERSKGEHREHLMMVEVLKFFDDAFGPKGLPVLVLRTILWELEVHANRFLGEMTRGNIFCTLVLSGDELDAQFFKLHPVTRKPMPREFIELSGGERRCAELAFTPFALSELIFTRTGVRIELCMVDELTTHLPPEEKLIVADILHNLNRETVLVIDHDATVQGTFDALYDISRDASGTSTLERAKAA